MDFGLSSDQVLLHDTLVRLLEDVAPLERVRAYAENDDDGGAEIWQALSEIGVPGLLVDERHGGAGLGVLDAALVAQALGAHVTPAPFVASAVLAPLALRLAGSAEQQAAWLPRLVSGATTVGMALAEHTGAREDARVTARDGRLVGRALFVQDIDADAFVVAARDRTLHLVPADAAGLTRASLVTIDRTRRWGELVFENTPAEPLAQGDAASTLAALVDHGRVMTAADTLGAAQHMLEAAVAYAGQREQFGRVIASFQAVKHLCAEMAAALEPCHALVWYAAHALDAVPGEAHLYACHAKAHLAEVGTQVAKSATEVHGGMGFTDLLGLHYWFKRIGLNRQTFGSPERAREDAARAQGFA
ncbi:MAG: acyl-CoA/acyl-ACP dehydrogenase [Gammaproteobacteria bacterium]|nr:acyl-CoA/acyl-ACP dehydrogenase [Gammaproteobacteria bacterium]